MTELQITLANPSQTSKLAVTIASVVMPGDLLYLAGNLGAGKTTLTKYIAEALGVNPQSVTSPTFTLVHEYRSGRLLIYHFDLYRLKSSQDLQSIGFDDYVAANDGVIIVEWANNAKSALPSEALYIDMDFMPSHLSGRSVTLSAEGSRPTQLLNAVKSVYTC